MPMPITPLREFQPAPDWERLRTALMLEGQPDRVPLVELIVDQSVKAALLGRPMAAPADEVDFWYQAGYDYVSLCPGYTVYVEGWEPKEGWRRSEVGSAYGAGAVQIGWGTEGAGMITSWDDFEQYPWPSLDATDWGFFDYCMDPAHLPPGMKVVGRAGDIFTHAWGLMGFNTFSFALVESPDLVAAMFQKIGEFIYGHFVRICERDTRGCLMGLWYSDDIAYTEGLLCSPAVFREHLFPWMARIGDLARQIGGAYLYHTDGRLWQVMDDFEACGINALQPIEPKAMDAAEVKAREGHRFCLCGNIEVDRLSRGTPDEVDRMVRDRIERLGPGGGYCVGSSNTVPYYVPFDNYVAMQNATFRYGRQG